MVLQHQPDLTAESAPEGEAATGSNDDLEVEAVATLRGDASRPAPVTPAVRVERLRRLALQLRVVTLQDELDRTKRQVEQIREQYEAALQRRSVAGDRVVGTWDGDDA